MITIVLSIVCLLLVVVVILLSIDRRRFENTVQRLLEHDAEILLRNSEVRDPVQNESTVTKEEREKAEQIDKRWSAGLGNIMAYDATQAREAVMNHGRADE